MKRFNKLVATLLCALMVFTSFNLNVFAENTSDELAIYSGSSIVSEIVLPSDEKVELQTSYDENSKYQWQLATDSNKTSWVNIYDQRGYSINLSYAMVSSLLDSSATTYVRVIKDEVVSQPVKVTVVQSNKQSGEVVDSAASAFRMLKSTNKINGATYNAEQPLADEQYNSYNIVVNYVYEDGSTAFDSYAANIEENGKFTTTVTFPTIVGYLPYDFEGNQINELKINIESVTSDVTYTITYKPTLVSYTVIHKLQNALDDNYEIHETEIKEGLTNSVVENCAKSYAGFTALLYETVKIAADGSTEVTVYYDRNYYLLNFDLDGGYGVEPIYARYGTKINDVGTPIKAGYIFDGWLYQGVEAKNHETIPAENRTYKANWKTNSTAKVTIVFWGENANDEDYSYIRSSSVYVKPATEFTYKEDGSLICALEVHSHSDECGYKCGIEQHTHSGDCYKLACNHAHTLDCYTARWNGINYTLVETSKPSETLTDLGNGIYTYTKYYDTHYYLNIGDKWYCAKGKITETNDRAEISLSCTHSHSADCYELDCDKTIHTHSDECYNCGKLQHTHQQECYMQNVGLDSNLWKFVKSDTVTVEADGSSVVNVYYDRTEKTLTFKYNYSDRDSNYQSTETITAKWGSNISEQYKKIASNAGSTFWSAKTSGAGPYTNYFGVMPEVSANYYNRGDTGKEGTMTYWGQDLNGEYTVKLFEVSGVGGYNVTVEDRYEFEGYTYDHGTNIGSSCKGASFYYTRNSYKLTFNDGYNEVRTENVKYQQSLSGFSSYVPEVPSAYEPGSVTFAGWYLNPECTGNEYKLREKTMPADSVLLYAKWELVTHTVKFYLDRETYENDGDTLASHPDMSVKHNCLINGVFNSPENGNYSFIGWFYLDKGEEKAFDFSHMPVTKDMEVYGKWSSNVLVEYKIKYVIYIDKEKDLFVEIADETTGSALAGTSKTFEAKTGTELNDGYQKAYYPNTGSHNMTMSIDKENVYIFEYIALPDVEYTVKYIDKATGKEMAGVDPNPKIVTTKDAVVTEVFVPITGYMPDAYQKRLVLSANKEENVIIFYYTADTENAYYVITHWVQNIEDDGYSEYRSIQAPGKIGSTISEEPLTIKGFTYKEDKSNASGKITAAGLELNLRYDRNTYPLTVQYLEHGKNTPLADPYTTPDLYRVGKQVSATAKDIKGYKLVGEQTRVKTISEPENSNVITFYYIEEEVTISYVAIEAGYGTVSVSQEIVKAKTGTASGSTPTAKPRYRFVGWYTDKECTKPVDTSWIDPNNKLVPQKVDGLNVSATYYAKFVENLGDLTIKKNGCSNIDENQTFLFRLKGLDEGVNDHIDMVVTIHGNGSVTIKDLFVGNYSVTELTDWSFRYTPDAVTKNVNVTTTGLELTFNNNRSLLWWLDGSNYKVNLFKQGN